MSSLSSSLSFPFCFLFLFSIFSIFVLAPQLNGQIPEDQYPNLPGSPYFASAYPLSFNITCTGCSSSIDGIVAYRPLGTSLAIPDNTGLGIFTARLVMLNSIDGNGLNGCGTITHTTTDDGTPIAGNVVIISRAGCGSSVKLANVNALNPSMIIFADNIPRSGSVFYNIDAGYVGVYTTLYNFPALDVTLEDGNVITNQWKINNSTGKLPVITFSVFASGNITPAGRQFLIDVANSTYSPISFLYDSAHIPPGMVALRYPNDVLTNPQIDSCVSRVYGIWCQNGEIIYIVYSNSGFTGTMPPSISKLHKLYQIDLLNSVSSSTVFSPTFCTDGGLPNLRVLSLSNSVAANLPDCFDTATPLFVALLADSSLLQTIPSSLARSTILSHFSCHGCAQLNGVLPVMQSPLLELFDIGGGHMTGSLFPIISPLNYFDVSYNQVGPVTQNMFDGQTNLVDIKMTKCNSGGVMPTLSGCTSLVLLDLSGNNLSGGIPATWGVGIPNLVTLYLSGNQIVLPISPLQALKKLSYVDLSHNNIPSPPGPPSRTNHAGTVILQAQGPVVAYLDMSYNNLTGPIYLGSFSNKFTYLINVAHNAITSLPPDLFSYTTLQHVDFSYNQLQPQPPSTGLTLLPNTPVTPFSNLTYMDFRNNPLFVSTSPIPWLNLSSSSLTKTPNTNYLCQILVPTYTAFATIYADPSFNNYAGCSCDSGFFGIAPSCSSIPAALTSTTISSLTPFNSTNAYLSTLGIVDTLYPRIFSDAWYGNSRSLPGIDTTWTVDASSVQVNNQNPSNFVSGNSPNPGFSQALSVNVIFFFNVAVFNQPTDEIFIFQGGNTLTGNLIESIRGNAVASFPILPAPLFSDSDFASLPAALQTKLSSWSSVSKVSVPVPVTIATIQFQSRATSGDHFYTLYTPLSSCPTGYSLDFTGTQCIPIVPEYHVSQGLLNGLYAATAVIGFFILIVFFVVLQSRNTQLIKASSQRFTIATLFGLLWLAGSASLYAIVPSNNSNMLCNARLWCSCLSLMMILGVLVAKSLRVSVIFGSKLLMQIRSVTDLYVMQVAGGLLLIEIIMLVIFTAVGMSWASLVSNGNNEVVWACQTGNGFAAWMGVQIAIFAVVMILGAVVAFRTRAVPSAFNESSHILFSLQILLFMLIILAPLDWALVGNSPEASIVIQCGGQLVLALFLVLSNFLPKLYYIFTGKANDKSMVFNTNSNKSSGYSNNSSVSSNISGRGSDNRPRSAEEEGTQMTSTDTDKNTI